LSFSSFPTKFFSATSLEIPMASSITIPYWSIFRVWLMAWIFLKVF
jgi:hypothetical protein